MALGTLAAIALGVSAAAGVGSVVQARNARKDQEAALQKQQDEAREAAALRDVRSDTGAEFQLGDQKNTRRSGMGGTSKRSAPRGSVLSSAGGLGASKRIGL